MVESLSARLSRYARAALEDVALLVAANPLKAAVVIVALAALVVLT